MRTTYLEYVEQDAQLHRAIGSVLPSLRQLRPDQIETLVFYLKSLNNYYPTSENSTDYWIEFSKKLDGLKVSPSQKSLQFKASKQLFAAMAFGGIATLALVVGVVGWLGDGASWGAGVTAAAVGIWLVGEAKFGRQALITAKEQDRRYFLESLRLAKGCNELDWAGLFSHNGTVRPGPQSDEDIEMAKQRVAELSAALRNALYNDQYMGYSYERPCTTERVERQKGALHCGDLEAL